MAFPALTVRENVQIALEHGAARHGTARHGTTRHGTARRWSAPEAVLEFVGLHGAAGVPANAMAFGDLRRLGIAVALAAGPAQLLLDEPAAGLNQGESEELAHLLRRVHRMGIGVCLVDHHVSMIAALCQRLIVLHFGTKIADGPTEAVLRDARVVEVYLGRDA
jgi:ABC-type branched-subunit amino acid transport system ATPase component